MPAPSLLTRGLQIKRGEWAAVGLSFAYFLLLLAAYYTLRPVRDALATSSVGAENLRFAFLSTFVVMLALVPVFGGMAARLPRRRLIPAVYLFFIANIAVFYGLFQRYSDTPALAYGFFVWLSVFNLFVVSVFWSFMADLFEESQARRLFGPIAAGGSLGAMFGPLLTRLLVEQIGLAQLMLVAMLLLAGALACMLALAKLRAATGIGQAKPMGGGALEGARLAFSHSFLRLMTLFMLLGTLTGSTLYLVQIEAVSRFDRDAETLTAFFAGVDLSVNVLSVVIQLTLTGRLLGWLGFPVTLSLLPALVLLGFGIIAAHPALWLIVGLQILRRGALFSVTNPVSQMLFTALGPHSKYKFKNFLDTVVYRAGDTLGSWLFAAVLTAGGGIVAAASIGCVIGAVWLALAARLGRQFRRLGETLTVPR